MRLIVIGGGPGGYVAAIRAAQLGMDVVIIERDKLGGTCLNYGCIPTKALYENARVLHTVEDAKNFGITINDYSVDMDLVDSRKQTVVNQLVGGVEHLTKAYKIEVIKGTASFIDSNTVKVVKENGETSEVHGDKFIIATGSKPFKPPIPGIDLPGVITSKEALDVSHLPDRLVIIGGGVIGMEFAGIYNSFGCQVDIVELMPTILPLMDRDISKRLQSLMKRQGVNVLSKSKVKEIRSNNDGLTVVVEDSKGESTIDTEQVLVSTGRSINVDGLNLDGIGVEYTPKGIKVNEQFATNVPHIYAVGDVIGGLMLAHVASYEGKVAVELMTGHESSINYNAIPSVVFTLPEVASVGLTEQEAKESGEDFTTSKFMFRANGKALAMRETAGFVKVVARKPNNEIIGVHILGAHASDLLHEGVIAVDRELTAESVSSTVHAHPTLAETFLEAVLGIEGRALHSPPPRR